MSVISALSTAVNGLHKSAERAENAAAKIVNFGGNTVSSAELPSSRPTVSGNNALESQLRRGAEGHLAGEFANLIEAEMAYKASAKMLQTADSMSKLTRDLLA